MSSSVSFMPANLNFGAVAPGASGPDITVDPSFGPPAISFAGAVQIKSVPVDAKITASISPNGGAFKVRDIIAMDWVWETVDPGELPPGHRGPPPKVKVLEVSNTSDGVSPLAVTAGQYVLVRVAYDAPMAGDAFNATLTISGDSWDAITVPLSLFLSGMATTVESPLPVELAQGTVTDMKVAIQVLAGPGSTVRYEISPTQLHSGVSIVGQDQFSATPNLDHQILQLRADVDAPLGENTLAINQFFSNVRTGILVPITMKPLSSVQKIRGLSIVPEPRNLVFSFSTTRLSIPVVTVWARSPANDPLGEMIPANQLGVATGDMGPQTQHFIGMSGIPDGAALWFRIDANVKQSGIDPSAFATAQGMTATLHRDCFVSLDRMKILQAGGDNSGPEDGNDILVSMVAYDADTGKQACPQHGHKFSSVDHGEEFQNIDLDGAPSLPVLRAPNNMIVYLYAVSPDADAGLGVVGTMVPPTAPTTQTAGFDDDASWADSFQPVQPHRLVGDRFSDTLTLSSGLTMLAYDAFVRVETVVTDPHGALDMVYIDLP